MAQCALTVHTRQIAWDGCSHNLFSESPVVHCSLFPSWLGPPSSTLISAISLPVASVLCFYGLKRICASLMGDQDTEGSLQSVYWHLQTRLLSGQLISLGKIWCQVLGSNPGPLTHKSSDLATRPPNLLVESWCIPPSNRYQNTSQWGDTKCSQRSHNLTTSEHYQ